MTTRAALLITPIIFLIALHATTVLGLGPVTGLLAYSIIGQILLVAILAADAVSSLRGNQS